MHNTSINQSQPRLRNIAQLLQTLHQIFHNTWKSPKSKAFDWIWNSLIGNTQDWCNTMQSLHQKVHSTWNFPILHNTQGYPRDTHGIPSMRKSIKDYTLNALRHKVTTFHSKFTKVLERPLGDFYQFFRLNTNALHQYEASTTIQQYL